MTKKKPEKRRDARPAESGSLWLSVMGELLKGGLVAVLAVLLALAVCAVFISNGVISEHAADRVVLAACVFGALFAVRKIGRSTLLVGAGVGAILFLLLLSIGALLFASVSLSNGGAAILLSCLCGGAMAGILGARRKKRKR